MNISRMGSSISTTRILRLAILVIVALGVLGVALGVAVGQSLMNVLTFVRFVGTTGGVLLFFMWWVQQARAQQYDEVTRGRMLRRSVVIIVLVVGSGEVVNRALHSPWWGLLASAILILCFVLLPRLAARR